MKSDILVTQFIVTGPSVYLENEVFTIEKYCLQQRLPINAVNAVHSANRLRRNQIGLFLFA